VQPCCSMTEMGYSLSTIAREINNKIRATLPVGRFVAAAIASIDPRTGTITVWNGGNPLCCLLDASGKVRKRFRSMHVPLGILDDASFDGELESAHYDAACQLFIASDGLIEAENETGVPFGEARALQVVAEALPALRLPALRGAIQIHLGAKMASDDISVVMVNCDQLPAAPIRSASTTSSGAELQSDAIRSSS